MTPPPESTFSFTPETPVIGVALEPAFNAIASLMLLNKADRMSGLADWVTRTAASMSREQREAHRVAFIGLYHALEPDRSWPSFPAYVDDLAARPAEALREQFLCGVRAFSTLMEPLPGAPSGPPPDDILGSLDSYLDYLRRYFAEPHLEIPVEIQTYALVQDPPAMQRMLVEHLRLMWTEYLAPEWARVEPLLKESVDAFAELHLERLSPTEAMRAITGRGVCEEWDSGILAGRRVVFVPSAHVGPYQTKFRTGQLLGIIFGARLPEGAAPGASALSRSELLVRLAALTDDTRLSILAELSRGPELCAQEIIGRLGISQSAASRHLQQLSATGYLDERRRDGGKCYTLNRERLLATLRAVERYLGLD